MHDGRRRRRGGAALVGGGDVLVVLLPERPHLRADHQVVDVDRKNTTRSRVPLLRDNRQPLRVPRLAAEVRGAAGVLRQVRGQRARAGAARLAQRRRRRRRRGGDDGGDGVEIAFERVRLFPRHRGEREKRRHVRRRLRRRARESSREVRYEGCGALGSESGEQRVRRVARRYRLRRTRRHEATRATVGKQSADSAERVGERERLRLQRDELRLAQRV